MAKKDLEKDAKERGVTAFEDDGEKVEVEPSKKPAKDEVANEEKSE